MIVEISERAVDGKRAICLDLRSFCPTGSGGGVDPTCGGASGGPRYGTGGDTSPGGKESYNDRIEGTQAGADREVTRAAAGVAKAKAAVDGARRQLDDLLASDASKADAIDEVFAPELKALSDKQAEAAAGAKAASERIAALKLLLKPKAKPKPRRDAGDVSDIPALLTDLERQIGSLKRICDDLASLLLAVEKFRRKIST